MSPRTGRQLSIGGVTDRLSLKEDRGVRRGNLFLSVPNGASYRIDSLMLTPLSETGKRRESRNTSRERGRRADDEQTENVDQALEAFYRVSPRLEGQE